MSFNLNPPQDGTQTATYTDTGYGGVSPEGEVPSGRGETFTGEELQTISPSGQSQQGQPLLTSVPSWASGCNFYIGQ
jgi:hypothetical protein